MSDHRSPEPKAGAWRRLLAAMCIGSASSACVNGASLPQPPISMAVDVSRAQVVVETEFEVKEEAFYAFNLAYPFKEGDKEDRARAVRLVGAPIQNPSTGRWDAAGAELELHLSVQALAADGVAARSIHESDVKRPRESSATADKLVSRLAAVRLGPGRFKVRLVNQHDAPKYHEARVDFSIVRAYMGK